MREFMIIFKQAFMTKAKTKSFIITTAIMIAAVFLFANMEKIIDTVKSVTGGDSDSAEVLQVIDESGVLADRLKVQFEANESGITGRTIQRIGTGANGTSERRGNRFIPNTCT